MAPVVNPETGKMPRSPEYYFRRLVRDNSWVDFNQPLRERLFSINRTDKTYELDVAMWYGTLLTAKGNLKKFLIRMFSVIYYGGLMFRSKDGTWKLWLETGTPLASTLSHGGRILIQLPTAKVKGASKFWDWMLSGARVDSGGIATHGVAKESKPYEYIYGDRFKYLKETHGKKTAVKHIGHHKRLNIALGGTGHINPWTRNRIADNGEHGHLYMYYRKPTSTTCGAIMLSLESEAYGKTGQTGHKHSMSASSEEFTATGGAKWVLKEEDAQNGFMALPDSDLRDRYDGMIIDLTGNGTARDIKFVRDSAQSLSIDTLAMAPCPPVALSFQKTLIPEIATWKFSTKGKKSRASVGIKTIDSLVAEYHTLLETGFPDTQMRYLRAMQAECRTWMKGPGVRHKNRKPGVQRLIGLINNEMKTYQKRRAIHFKKHPLSGAKALQVDSSKVYRKNFARFLMDGEEFFREFESVAEYLVEEIEKEKKALGLKKYVPPQTYFRMAFWLYEKNSPFISPSINSLINAGVDVDIILYYPTEKEQYFAKEGERVANKNIASAQLLVKANEIAHKKNKAGDKRIGNIRVYLEKYEGWIGASNHQKIAIFSIKGQRTAFIGGFNLATYYYDNVDHNLLDSKNDRGWHDTAIRIKGPATREIEKEWLRRWRRAVELDKKAQENKSLRKYVKTGDENISFAELIHNTTVQDKFTASNEKQNRFGKVDIQIAITRTGKTTRINQIKQELTECIGRATKFIYLENVGLTDPDLIRAVYNRMKQKPDLKVIVVTNANHKQRCDIDGLPMNTQNSSSSSFLTRRAWLQLALRSRKKPDMWIEYESSKSSEGKKKVTDWVNVFDSAPIGSAITSLEANISNRWLSNDKVTMKSPNSQEKLYFQAITDFNAGIYFYTPIIFRKWEYGQLVYNTMMIHSKLAIIDDVLVIGSSNWTYRSMNYDGEMVAICKSKKLAQQTLKRLLSHYDYRKRDDIDGFEKSALENINALLEIKKVKEDINNKSYFAGYDYQQEHFDNLQGTYENKIMIVPIEYPRFPWVRFQRTPPPPRVLDMNHTWL